MNVQFFQSTTALPACSQCSLRETCIASALVESELEKFEKIISRSQRITRGLALYQSGDTFSNIYIVRAGSFKTVAVRADGREQITDFILPGELLGMDGISSERHSCAAIAMEDSVVCILPFRLLEELCRANQQVQRHIHQLMCAEFVRRIETMMLLAKMRVEERVAIFLLGLSRRFKQRGYSATEFNLRMTRDEMANFLGMRLETISRTLSQFQRQKLIHKQGKSIRIINNDGLAQLESANSSTP